MSATLSAVVSGMSLALEIMAAAQRVTEAVQKSTDGKVPPELWKEMEFLLDMSEKRRDLAIQKARDEQADSS